MSLPPYPPYPPPRRKLINVLISLGIDRHCRVLIRQNRVFLNGVSVSKSGLLVSARPHLMVQVRYGRGEEEQKMNGKEEESGKEEKEKNIMDSCLEKRIMIEDDVEVFEKRIMIEDDVEVFEKRIMIENDVEVFEKRIMIENDIVGMGSRNEMDEKNDAIASNADIRLKEGKVEREDIQKMKVNFFLPCPSEEIESRYPIMKEYPIMPYVFVFFKPEKCVTACWDEKHVTVMDYFRNCALYNADFHSQVVPVGRLDFNTTGLLLFTNDGHLQRAILSKETHLPKRYRCFLEKECNEEDVLALQTGVQIITGENEFRNCLPAKVTIVEPQIVDLEIVEGAFHQVKKMWLSRGNYVQKLSRLSIGPFGIGSLEEGQFRQMSNAEIMVLYREAKMENSFFAACIE